MAEHALKTWPGYFADVVKGRKTYELRENDRNFMVGDTLLLREFIREANDYTGREVRVRVVYMTIGPIFGLKAGYCILGIEPTLTGDSDANP